MSWSTPDCLQKGKTAATPRGLVLAKLHSSWSPHLPRAGAATLRGCRKDQTQNVWTPQKEGMLDTFTVVDFITWYIILYYGYGIRNCCCWTRKLCWIQNNNIIIKSIFLSYYYRVCNCNKLCFSEKLLNFFLKSVAFMSRCCLMDAHFDLRRKING